MEVLEVFGIWWEEFILKKMAQVDGYVSFFEFDVDFG